MYSDHVQEHRIRRVMDEDAILIHAQGELHVLH